MVNCSICDEPYGDDRQPLLLACCKGAALCEECLTAHLRVSNRCPLLCQTRPSVRHFVKQCLEATPPMEEFLKSLEAREKENEENSGPITVELGEAGLFNAYVESREIQGDAQIALQLQMKYEDEQRKIKEKNEDKDLSLARRLQEREHIEKENLRKRLTKRPSDINSMVVRKIIEKESKVRTLDEFFKPEARGKPLSPNNMRTSSASLSPPATSPKKRRIDAEIICLD